MEYIYIETYGCAANQNNSEILKGILTQSGYKITNNQDIADILILNSCIVKSKTENKIKRRIQDISKTYLDKLLIITGCMPETDAKQIKKLNKNTILLGTHHFKKITTLIKDYHENKLFTKQNHYLLAENEEKILAPKIPQNKLISITQISEGCLGNCTYCKTRIAKGKLFSYPIDKIVLSIESDLQNGAKEVWITSQDNANYGLDEHEHKLPELLNKILKLKHKFKLRLGMMDPNNVLPILDELISLYSYPKMYKFFHIPIQSGSNKVLKHMNRFYTIQEAEQIISKFKNCFPNITIAIDIIIGYPTETESDFNQTFEFIEKIRPDVFNLSKMSIHKQTKAGKLKPLPILIINKRTSKIMQLHKQTASENKKKFLNKIIKVFVNKKLTENFYEARDDNYNIVLIRTDNDKGLLGKTIEVKIIQTGVHHMIGEILS